MFDKIQQSLKNCWVYFACKVKLLDDGESFEVN